MVEVVGLVYSATVLGQDPPRRMCHLAHAVKPLDAGIEAQENQRHDCDCDKDTACSGALRGRKRAIPLRAEGDCYFPFTMEQWVAAVFHVPESLIQVSLQITVRARCVPLSSAS